MGNSLFSQLPAPKQSPGPNGMTPLFFQTYWDIVKTDLCTIQLFFESGHLLEGINHTFISLIPKHDHPTQASHFRPISLCNTIYKIALIPSCLALSHHTNPPLLKR